MFCIKPNNSQSSSPLQLLKPSQVSRDPAVSVRVFIRCCRSWGSLPWEASHKEMGLVEGKVPAQASLTFPYPPSRLTSAWEKLWPCGTSACGEVLTSGVEQQVRPGCDSLSPRQEAAAALHS